MRSVCAVQSPPTTSRDRAGTDPDTHAVHSSAANGTKLRRDLSWGEAAKFLRRCANSCADYDSWQRQRERLLRVPRSGVNLVKAYAHEPMWSPDEMEKIGPGGVACKKLFEWMLAVLKVVSVQEQFIESERDWPEGEEFWPREGEEEQAADRAEDVMCKAQEAELERQYVPADLLLAYRKRPRPVVLAVARDVPALAKKRMIDRLMADFPSLFVRINAPDINVAAVQAVLDLGNSVVLDVDVGIGARNAVASRCVHDNETSVDADTVVRAGQGRQQQSSWQRRQTRLGVSQST